MLPPPLGNLLPMQARILNAHTAQLFQVLPVDRRRLIVMIEMQFPVTSDTRWNLSVTPQSSYAILLFLNEGICVWLGIGVEPSRRPLVFL